MGYNKIIFIFKIQILYPSKNHFGGVKSSNPSIFIFRSSNVVLQSFSLAVKPVNYLGWMCMCGVDVFPYSHTVLLGHYSSLFHGAGS